MNAITEQCPGCGEDVTTKRGPVEGRMCPACQRAARQAVKAAPKPAYEPTYDALGFCTGYKVKNEDAV